jgi:hypothetical protein
MRVHGPDGRVWSVARRTDPPRVLGALLPGGQWVVEATTDDEVRRWGAASRRDAAQLVDLVALALRTGAESPSGELPAGGPASDDGRAADPIPADEGSSDPEDGAA